MVKCDLCGGSKRKFLFNQKDRMFNIAGEYKLYRCGCGLIYLDPVPSKEELGKHYPPQKYYSLNELSISETEKKAYSSYKTNNFIHKLLRPFFRSLEVVRGGNFLDIGCGSGKMVKVAKDLGMVSEGVEPGKIDKAVAKKEGLKIYNGDLQSVKFKSNYFDVITMNHVFEHVRDPTETLIEIKRVLKKGGKLIIAVPNTDSWIFKIFGRRWVSIDSPRHLYLYKLEVLRKYAQKVGLEIEGVRCYGNSPFWESLDILREDNKRRLGNNRTLHYLILPISLLLNFFKRGDTLEVKFIKK